VTSVVLDHPQGGGEHDARLLSVRSRRDHLTAGFLLRDEGVEQPQSGGERRLAGAAWDHDEGRAYLATTRLVDRAVDLADQTFLPVGERKRLAGEAAFMEPKLPDEPDRLVRPAERVGIGSSDQSQAGPARSEITIGIRPIGES
jgi:hypothetical protein